VRLSASIDVSMLLAAQEAIAAGCKEIEPEHLFEALLKLSEIPSQELEKMTNNQTAAKELVKEAASVRNELGLRSIESTRVRHDLRAALGKGKHDWDGGRIPRSEATRGLFEVAAKAAEEGRTGVLSATHLLDALLRSPTAQMARILGSAAGPVPHGRRGKSLIDQYGKDLLPVRTNSDTIAALKAQCRALNQALSSKRPSSIFLITKNESLAFSVIRAALPCDVSAFAQGRRIVDVTSLKPAAKVGAEVYPKLKHLLAEASSSPELVLFLPSIEMVQGGHKENQWVNTLKGGMAKNAARCICRVDPDAYEHWIKPDLAWRRIAQVIWLSEAKDTEIPSEL
jgi:ATP-dependent Clp protease ATP-binding subunit ClpA